MNTWADHVEADAPAGKEVPLCLNCLEPVDPLDHVCPHCGGAVGQLTPYLPFEGIRWEAGIWGRMWRQAWEKKTPFIGRVFRLLVIVWFVPVLLVGLIPLVWRWVRPKTV